MFPEFFSRAGLAVRRALLCVEAKPLAARIGGLLLVGLSVFAPDLGEAGQLQAQTPGEAQARRKMQGNGDGKLEDQFGECASVRSPAQAAWSAAMRDSLQQTAAQRGVPGASDLPPVNLPVQWHIVRSSAGLGGLEDAETEQLLDTLNHFFRPAGIRFYACGPPNSIQSDAHYRLSTIDETALCSPNDRSGAINIYIVDELLFNSISICGYAYFPGSLDRVLLDADCARNGNTIVHELGHYLGLEHTHGSGLGNTLELVNGSNCGAAGDAICDTPADPGLTYFSVSAGCVYGGTATDANGHTYQPATDNFMSYARLSCRRRFTRGQMEAMAWSAHHERAYLHCACAPPSALEAKVNGNRALLQWAQDADHDVYRLTGEALAGPQAGQAGSKLTRKRSVPMPPLRPGTAYAWTVQARCTDGSFSLVSWPDTFKTDPPAMQQRDALPDQISGGLSERANALGLLDWGPVPVTDRLWMRWHRKEGGWLQLQLVTPEGRRLDGGKLYLDEGLQRLSWPMPEGHAGSVILVLELDGQRLRIPLLLSP